MLPLVNSGVIGISGEMEPSRLSFPALTPPAGVQPVILGAHRTGERSFGVHHTGVHLNSVHPAPCGDVIGCLSRQLEMSYCLCFDTLVLAMVPFKGEAKSSSNDGCDNAVVDDSLTQQHLIYTSVVDIKFYYLPGVILYQMFDDKEIDIVKC